MLILFLLVVSLGFNYFFAGHFRQKTGWTLAYFRRAMRGTTTFCYEGAVAYGQKRGHYNLVLRSGNPFSVLAGIELDARAVGLGLGFDPIEVASSRQVEGGGHEVVIYCFLGDSPVQFLFLHDLPGDAPLEVTIDWENRGEPTVRCIGHWWQVHLGWFA